MSRGTTGPPLAQAQRQLRRWIAAPSGVEAALTEGGEAGDLTRLLRGDERLSAARRLEVYANAYFYRILECLADQYEALAHGLGEALFHDLVTAYLLAHPPHHPSLRYAGARLADFLAEHTAAAPFRRRCAWAPDLARLEAALADAFDATDAPGLAREELAAIPPERWSGLRLAFLPAFRLLELDWPVERAWEACRREEPPPEDLPRRPTALCVWRSDERARYRRLDAFEARALRAARDGASFGELCVALAENVGDGEAPGRAAALLSRWQADGLLAAARPVLGQP